MFKMNPSAKEFVPAHVLKKRQEEAERLGEITQKLDNVDLKSEKGDSKCEEGIREKPSEVSERVQNDNSSKTDDSSKSNEASAKPETNNKSSTTPTNNQQQQDSHPTQEPRDSNVQHSSNNYNEADYPEGLQDLIDEEEDRFLLNAGENLCEFNGEQYIIPGDDEYEPAAAVRAGYDFGNNEDNEDEDVCNAFEEFLENLPGQ